MNALERFWSRVDKSGDCWTWTGGKIKQGYGNFYPKPGVGGILAHRFAYATYVGELLPGMVIDHLCRNRLCVNPEHLEQVTNLENLRRGLGYRLQNGMDNSCLKGHEYTPENTYRHPQFPHRVRCRECAREADRARSPGPRKLNAIDPKRVRELYESGLGATAIRKILGVGLPRLYRAMDELGLDRRPVGRVPKSQQKVNA